MLRFMAKLDLFKAFSDHQCSYNLEKCLPYIVEGRIRSPKNSYKPVHEGRENKEYDGITVFMNGNTLIDKLQRTGLVNPKVIGERIPISSIDDMSAFLEGSEDEDGVYVYEPAKDQLVRIAKIKDSGKDLYGIPPDFVFYGSDLSIDDMQPHIGTKTRLANELVQTFPGIEAFQIKRSGYTPLGMGKVTHFTSQGLARELYFAVEGGNVVGKQRTYEAPDLRRRTEETVYRAPCLPK